MPLPGEPGWTATLPPLAEKPKRGWFSAGLSSGIDQLQSIAGSAIQGAGNVLGAPGVEELGREIADRNIAEAQANGRPDLDADPWSVKGLAYQATKQLPTLGAYLLAGRFVPQSMIGPTAARVGAQVPRALGGGGLRAGATMAERRAALAAGTDFARTATGAAAAGVPLGFGSMVQEADQQPGGATHEDVMSALRLSPVYGALDALEPAQVKGLLTRGLKGNIFKRIATAGLVGGAIEVPQEGAQTALEQSFRDDLTPREKINNIVDGALLGGAIGGIFGGIGGIRRMKALEPRDVDSQTLKDNIDEELGRAVEPEAPQQPVLALPAPPTFVDSGGRAVVGSDGIEQINAAPVEREDPRPLVDVSNEDLERAVKLAASGSGVEPDIAEAAQRELNLRRGATEQISDAPVSANTPFEVRLAELKRGARNQWVVKLDAKDEADLIDKVHKRIFEDQDESKGTTLLAQRLGVLDADLNPTPLAAEIESRKNAEQETALAENETAVREAMANVSIEPEPKVDPKFRRKWQEMLSKTGLRDPAVRALKPTSLKDLDRKLYRALGGETITTTVGGRITNIQGESDRDGIEKLAKARKLLDENGNLTPKAIKLARDDMSVPMQDSVKAAMAQGFTGQAASAFDRGVQTFIRDEKPPKFESFEDLKAFQAGQAWAQNQVAPATASAEQSNRVMSKAQVATRSPTIPEDQRRMQVLNAQLDAGLKTGELTADEVVPIRRLVNAGAMDIEEAIRYTKTGRGALLTDNPQRKPYKGETVTRGLTQRTLARQRALIQQDRDRSNSNKQADLVESARAIKKHLLQKEIDAAAESEEITRRDRIIMVHRLVNNDFQGVIDRLPGGKLYNAQHVSRREFLAGTAAAAATMVGAPPLKAVTTTPATGSLRKLMLVGNVKGALQHIKQHSTNDNNRMVAAKLLRGEGWENVSMTMTDESPVYEATTELNNDGTSSILIYGDRALTEEVMLHEAIHAFVHQRWANISLYDAHNKQLLGDNKDRADTQVLLFQSIWTRIGAALKLTNPELIDTEVWAQNVYADPDEALSWILTNADAQAYLRSIDMDGNKVKRDEPSLWDQIVSFFRNLLGLPDTPKARSALDDLLSAGYSLLDAGAGVRPDDFGMRMKQAIDRQNARSMSRVSPPRNAMELNRRTQEAVSTVVAAADRISKNSTLGLATRRAVLGWNSISHMVSHYAKQFPELELYAKTHSKRRATMAKLAQLFDVPYQAYQALENSDPRAAQMIGELMALTQFEIDPTRLWSNHEHLHDSPNEATLRRLVAEGNRKYNLLRGRGHAKIYDDFRAVNEATHNAMMSVSLYNLLVSDPTFQVGVVGADVNPIDAFRELANMTPAAVQEYWARTLDEQVRNTERYLIDLQGELLTATPAAIRSASIRVSPVELRLKSIKDSRAAMAQAPYFHLGRFGNHFVSFTMRKGEDKNVDPRAIDYVARTIAAAGFDNVEISRDSTKPNVYIRVETIEARRQLEKLAKQLQADGWLDPDVKIKAAQRSSTNDTGTADIAPEYINRLIQSVEASPMFEPVDGMSDKEKAALKARKEQTVAHIRELWLDMLPDTALSKVMVHRNAVPGFNKDMIQNFAFRYEVGINALTNLAAAPELNNAFKEMKDAVNKAMPVDGPRHAQVDLLQDLLAEIMVRESQRSITRDTDWSDVWRAWNHAYFLGMSPSYVLVNTTQLGVLLWPELAKKHGFVKSAKAIADVTPVAFKIMWETFQEGKKLSGKRAADAVITDEALARAGISRESATADFLRKIIASGVIDIGSSARELGRTAEGNLDSTSDTILRYASSAGLYSETFTRLVAALAARKLHGGSGEQLENYVYNVVEESMLNYSTWNTARQMSKNGFLGKMGPVAFSFLQYTAQVIQKLYRELHAAFMDRATNDRERAEARRFLAYHSVAITGLAGTLGLPFATAAAWATEKLVDLFDDDDEPFDATAAWRNYMADIFGKDIGAMVSRGIPRAFGEGFDLSSRTGEHNLLPGSQFLIDRRKWQDAAQDQALRSWGAPVSMGVNIFSGGSKIMEGDLMGGMKEFMPMMLKGPVEAVRMAGGDYVDGRGNKLPIKPSTAAILMQSMGLSPHDKAEYSEARGDQAAREVTLQRRATVLRKKLVDAVMEGDQARQRELIAEAQKFGANNPTYDVLSDIEGSIRRRMKLQAISQATGTPLGTNPADLDARRLTRYADVEYQAQ